MDRRLNRLLDLLSLRPASERPTVAGAAVPAARDAGPALEERLRLIERFHEEWRLLEEDAGLHPDRQLAAFAASGYLDQFARHLDLPFVLLDSQGLLLRASAWPEVDEGAPLAGHLEVAATPGRMRFSPDGGTRPLDLAALRIGSGLLLVDDRAL